MSFPRYPTYKDSGVEWLGQVPGHWYQVRVKNIFTIGRGRVISLDVANEDGAYPVFSSQTSNDGCLGYIETYDFDCDQLTWTTDGANAGTVFLRKGKHNCTNVCGTLQVKTANNYNLSFGLFYLSFATQFYKRPDTNGAKIMNGEMAEIVVLVPPSIEQTQIATFLDRETAKIDGLVAEQRRLMDLLKEKRQAVISHAVTQGLNPHAPMKPSGIEWLGDMPAHWEVSQSRRMFVVRSEPALASDRMLTASQKYGVLFQSDFVEREGRRVVEVIMGKESLKHVEPDDFIISMRSFQGGIEWCKLRGSTSFHYVMLKPVKGVYPPFFAHLFKSVTYIQALRTTTDLIRDGQELRYSNFVQVDLPLVPMEEQKLIAVFLDRETAKFDTLTAEAQRAIDLLQERRTALISAAVTGQIDVRSVALSP